MSSLFRVGRRLAGTGLCLMAASLVHADITFAPQGGEYKPIGTLGGDQVYAQTAINGNGGYVVWHDNLVDGEGFGIGARRLNSNLSGVLDTFKVNKLTAGDQMHPQVAMLKDGGAVFVWQGGTKGFSKIYARFMSVDGVFTSEDVQVSDFDGKQQVLPVVATLENGEVVIAWSSYAQEKTGDGSPVAEGHFGVFARRFAPSGQPLANEFQVNTTTRLNQRSPSVSSLAGGGFVVAWVNESELGAFQNVDPKTGRANNTEGGLVAHVVTVQGQVFKQDGTRNGSEFQLSPDGTLAANPFVASTGDGFAVAWSGRKQGELVTHGGRKPWMIYARLFASDGVARTEAIQINQITSAGQFLPKIGSINGVQLVVWTSLNIDGSREGVSSRLLGLNGALVSDEHRVNATTSGSQILPSISTDGVNRFFVVWSSFVGGKNSMDLFAQRFSTVNTLEQPAAPYVQALSSTKLSVTWPELDGYQGVSYELYIDGNATALVVADNKYTLASLSPSSEHTFKIAYRLADGSKSGVSEVALGKTWGEDNNFDGLPDDWQTKYFGSDPTGWKGALVDNDGDGASNLSEYLAGTDPADPGSVLKASIVKSQSGLRLSWNSQPGSIYQVQISTDMQNWLVLGSSRFAAEKTDSIPVSSGSSLEIYRVIKAR